MRFFHRTSESAADRILTEGFRDRSGYYGFEGYEISGVWLSDVPLDPQEGTGSGPLLVVDLNLTDSEAEQYQIVETGEEPRGTYREWVMPANFVKARGSVRRATDAEEEEGNELRIGRSARIVARLEEEGH
jgi:hypothetical protein